MGFNGWTFLFQVVNFVVLAYALHRLLYKPLQEAIEARRQATLRAQAEAERVRREALDLQEKLRREELAQEERRQELLRTSRQQAEADARRLLAEAETTAQRHRDEAREVLRLEREETLEAVRKEVVAYATRATGRLLQQAADRTLEQQLARHLVEAVRAADPAQRDRLRASWTPADGACVESATPLADDTLTEIGAAVAEIMGHPVELQVRQRPELLAGSRLRLGGWIWDASMADQLEAVTACSPGREAGHG